MSRIKRFRSSARIVYTYVRQAGEDRDGREMNILELRRLRMLVKRRDAAIRIRDVEGVRMSDENGVTEMTRGRTSRSLKKTDWKS